MLSKTVLAAALLLAATRSTKLTWNDKRAMPVPVAGGYAVAIGEKLIYAGGTMWRDGVKHWLRDVNQYDVPTDTWTSAPVLPHSLAYGGFAVVEGAVEIFGGTDGTTVSRESLRLDHGASWISTGKLSFDSLLSRAVSVSDKVYIFGGCPDVADLTKCTDAVHFREKDGSWRKISAMPSGNVASFAAVSLGNNVYLFGGCSMASAHKLINRDDAYRFDVSTGKWHRLRPLPAPNRGVSAVPLDGEHILLLGGYTASSEQAQGKPAEFGFTNAVFIYNIQKDEYAPATPLPFAVAGMEAVAAGQQVVALGGEDRMRGRTARVIAGKIH